MKFITLTKENIDAEHLCCAFADQTVEKLSDGFSLLALKIDPGSAHPVFKECVKSGECLDKNGLVVYYTNRCPFADYYVNGSLCMSAQTYRIPLKIIRLDTMEQARSAPSPATIFSVFYNGKFITTDLSICTASRFAKILKL